MAAMLRSQYRLRKSADLSRIRRDGQVWRHPLAILLVRTNDQATSRFAFTASRRVGNAVCRNRARRLMRQAVRCHLAEIEPGWDLLFVAKEKTAGAPLPEVEAAVLRLLTHANILTKDQARKDSCFSSAV